MNSTDKKTSQFHLTRWYYWIFVFFSVLIYTLFCWWFSVEAWGYRGEPKPWWFEIAFVLAMPGMSFPPYFGTLLWGGLMGFGIIKLVQWIWRIRQHRLLKKIG
jgi:hypothetical protein